MDQLHQQIRALEQKLDRIYQVVENLNQQLSSSSGERDPNSPMAPRAAVPAGHPQDSEVQLEAYQAGGLDGFLEHKDVLLDTNEIVNPPNQTQTQPVSLDIQVRRLNAQLTAAYNRIAALEEQLLANRTIDTASA
ncbi:MAG: hypothetical protein AAFY11_11065 [Cyanobacteria bacterium J06641_5]